MPISIWLSILTSHYLTLQDTRRRSSDANESGSVTLEQVVIAAGLLAAAVGLVAVIVAVVSKYSGKIN